MAAFQSRTREQIRRSIAANLDQSPASSASGNGSTTTLVDANYIGGDDEFNGGWLVFTSGTNDGLIRRVTDYASSSGTFTFKPAATAATASSDTYEYWCSLLYTSAAADDSCRVDLRARSTLRKEQARPLPHAAYLQSDAHNTASMTDGGDL